MFQVINNNIHNNIKTGPGKFQKSGAWLCTYILVNNMSNDTGGRTTSSTYY